LLDFLHILSIITFVCGNCRKIKSAKEKRGSHVVHRSGSMQSLIWADLRGANRDIRPEGFAVSGKVKFE